MRSKSVRGNVVPVSDNRTLVVNSRIQVPRPELEITYARSSGPGGQNVNKVSSKAVLRWSVLASSALPPDVRERFLKRYGNRRQATAS
jgi:ribosome-associated protein